MHSGDVKAESHTTFACPRGRDPAPHLTLLPRPPAGLVPSQATGGRAGQAQVQPRRGWGWSRRFLPRHRFPQLLAGPAMPGRKAGRREAANSHVQPGLSKHRFLPPPSAALATVASGWLTMLAGAGAL